MSDAVGVCVRESEFPTSAAFSCASANLRILTPAPSLASFLWAPQLDLFGDRLGVAMVARRDHLPPECRSVVVHQDLAQLLVLTPESPFFPLATGNRTVPYFKFLEKVTETPAFLAAYNAVRRERVSAEDRVMILQKAIGASTGLLLVACHWLLATGCRWGGALFFECFSQGRGIWRGLTMLFCVEG